MQLFVANKPGSNLRRIYIEPKCGSVVTSGKLQGERASAGLYSFNLSRLGDSFRSKKVINCPLTVA